MAIDDLPRVHVAHLPTPLEPLTRLTARLGGPDLWVKRDDQTGLATGGNKTRKLEFLVADALGRAADALITCGAAQSNHARQTAAAARKFGLDPVLVLRGTPPDEAQGNLLIDHLLGAQIVWAGDQDLGRRMEDVASRLRDQDRRPYVVPYGGSNAIGAAGYALAMRELLTQSDHHELTFDAIVLASSSGGTQAGLTVGARLFGYQGRILGISVEPYAAALRSTLADLAHSTATSLDARLDFEPQDFAVNDGYLGGGYGVVGGREREAIRLLAQTEGLLLDPVYTGRAFAGLLDLIRAGDFTPDQKVLFWHTGGTTGLFAKAEDVLLNSVV
jgi:D-cysteine desulfhydrase